ncbi:LppA family lipoprotein [Rhodococcus sp. ARC_M6]
MRVDLPGRHDVQLVSDDGRLVRIGSFKAASFSANTGCRLREAELGGAH